MGIPKPFFQKCLWRNLEDPGETTNFTPDPWFRNTHHIDLVELNDKDERKSYGHLK